MIELAWKWALVCLPLPYVVYRLLPPAKRLFSAIKVPFFARLAQDNDAKSAGLKSGLLWLSLLAWCALVVAVARPQWVGEPIAQALEGRDLMLAVDLSGSMQERDMVINGQRVDRLAAVKSLAGDFIDRRIGDRIGLILFGDNAYLQTPLTLDRRTVKTQLYEAFIGLAGGETAIGDAIGLAVKRLQDRAAAGKILILLTDGENTAGEFLPQQTAALAEQTGLKIYTIGIGRESVDFFGRRSGIDEKTLQAIAAQTGGQYFRAADAQSLAQIYQYIDELEPIAAEVESLRPVIELYFWPGGLAWLLALIVLMLSSWQSALAVGNRHWQSALAIGVGKWRRLLNNEG